MEKDEILTESAGRLLDCLIMENVFKVETTPVGDDDWYSGIPARPIPLFSTDISAAWEVVKEMSAKNYWCHMGVLSSSCFALFSTIKPMNQFKAEATTYDLPLAICRAALLAMN